MRVLLADDSDTVRRRVAALVGDVPGARIVAEAADAPTAIAAAAAHRPDVIVLDVMMPGGGGRAVMDALGSGDGRAAVIVFTNHADEETRAAFLARGARHVLDKTHDIERLVAVLADLARGRAG
jgi:DNA-binding NarL/FixJ family response regulator